jgi:hypothetical protein
MSPPFLPFLLLFLKKTIFKKKIMSASKGRRMTTIKEREERLKKAEGLLKTAENQFPSDEKHPPFTAFVDRITLTAIYDHVRQHWEYGDKITKENEEQIIKYGNWIVYPLYSTVNDDEKIKILTFPRQGNYYEAE